MIVTADYIFTGNNSLIKNGIVITDKHGKIEAVIDPSKQEKPAGKIIKHKGIICPGFINTHCHLELSYLKGKVAENTQLSGFVDELMTVRDNFSVEERLLAVNNADEEMYNNGIVAVGDISNGSSTFQQKKQSKIKYHTFIEVFGLNSLEAKNIYERTKQLKQSYFSTNHISITPHAPYSLSNSLKELINQEHNELMTIHNQETESENELFKSGSGALFNQISKFSEEIKNWQPTGKNSLPSYLASYNRNQRVLLVHNTFTNQLDIDFAKNLSDKIYWCFCPNANLYIEGTQPDYSLFLDEKCTIGTDSLASNWSLSVLDELKTIQQKNEKIGLEKLLKWATINGAKFLGFDNEFGSLDVGKTPGINLIENVDLEKVKLTDNTKVSKLI